MADQVVFVLDPDPETQVVEVTPDVVVTMEAGEPPPPVPVGDVTPPVVSAFDPAPGAQIQRTAPIEFDVTDDSGSFARIFVVALFKATGAQEVVHDGDAFVGFYTATSSRVPITNGFRYTVARFGGWPAAPTIRVFPIDAAGNEL